MPQSATYHAIVRDNEYEVDFGEAVLKINGIPEQASLVATGPGTYSLLLEGKSYDMHIHREVFGSYTITINGTAIQVNIKNRRDLLLQQFGMSHSEDSQEKIIKAPMPGLVLDVLIEEGQHVEKGQGILILEAMKMENELKAPAPGVIKKIHTEKGAAISKNDLLVEIS